MSIPRLRMVAGPNGSGKTTLVEFLRDTLALRLGYTLNPDELDQELAQFGRIDLGGRGVRADSADLLQFVEQHPLFPRAGIGPLNILHDSVVPVGTVPSGYLASIISDYLRRRWLDQRATFTFETVMSSPDKLDLLSQAQRIGYRTYLYYVCTEAPLINQRRIANRVRDGGHDVPAEKILPRYERSLALLPEAVRLSTRAYLFDNSGQSHLMFAEFESGHPTNVAADVPEWFQALKI